MASSLYGRDELLRQIAARMEAGSGGVVLVGEQGIGKSRLARELVRIGAERGYMTVRVIGTQAATSIPLGALSHVLADMHETGVNVLVNARRALVDQAGNRSLLLSIDDAHLVDAHSAALTLQLAMSVPCFVVATARAGEPLPDAIDALWKEGIADRIEVPPLDQRSIGRVITAVLAGTASSDLLGEIASRSSGNPLVATELTMAAVESGVVSRDGGQWRITGELPVSPRLRQMVETRLGGLPDSAGSALVTLAYGEPLSVDLAERLLGRDALIELERVKLIEVRRDGRRMEIWLAHPIYGLAVREATGALAAADTRRLLIEATRETGMRRLSDIVRVASWSLDTGEVDRETFLAAAHAAYRVLDMSEAAKYARAAWDAQPDYEAGFLLGSALSYLLRFAEADVILATTAKAASTPDERARALATHSTVLWAGLGLPEAAIDVLSAAAEELTGEARQLVQGQHAYVHSQFGRSDETLAMASELVDHGSGAGQILATLGAQVSWIVRGEYQKAIESVERSLGSHRDLWEAGQIQFPPDLQNHHRDISLLGLGVLQEIHESLAEAEEPLSPRIVSGWRTLNAARIAYLKGRPLDAERALESLEERSGSRPQRYVLALLALVRAITGRASEARAALDVASAVAGNVNRAFDSLVDEARIWTLIAEGRPEEARTHGARALEREMEMGRWGMAHALAHDLSRAGDVAGAAERLRQFDVQVEGDLALARERHMVGRATGDADTLESAYETFVDLGADLFAAEAAASAARAARKAGEARRSVRLRRLSAEAASRCQGALTPALFAGDELVPLTEREREVAHLASTGMSSGEIADRLFISIRTVNNHLQRAFEKLGVGSRRELREALNRPKAESSRG